MNQMLTTELKIVIVGNPNHWIPACPQIASADSRIVPNVGQQYVPEILRSRREDMLIYFQLPGGSSVAVLSKN